MPKYHEIIEGASILTPVQKKHGFFIHLQDFKERTPFLTLGAVINVFKTRFP